jgi:hypothetical protein
MGSVTTVIRESRLCPVVSRRPEAGRRLVVLVSCLMALSPVLCAELRADRSRETFIESEEGGRLASFWQTMTDHSSGAVYAPDQFQTMAGGLDEVDKDLKALRQRGAIPAGAAEQLRAVFHARYGYIRESQYSARSAIHASGAEAARSAARWVIEFQLDVLRKPSTCKAEETLHQMALSNVGYQLTFLSHLDAFEAEADRRRMALRERQDHGETVDMAAFEAECEMKRIALLDAYRDKKLPKAKSVEQVLPYVLALARAKPAPQTIAGASATRPSF